MGSGARGERSLQPCSDFFTEVRMQAERFVKVPLKSPI
jgi:hypothetical protein